MKDLGFFITGLVVGVAVGGAVVFAMVGNTIRVEVQVPSEYNIGGIPSDFTIRGGVNLSPVPGGSSVPGLPSTGGSAPGSGQLAPGGTPRLPVRDVCLDRPNPALCSSQPTR
mgnify:CR=1 FL=1